MTEERLKALQNARLALHETLVIVKHALKFC